MDVNEMKAFIRVITEYFEQVSGESAQMGVPYVRVSNEATLSYTAIIAVSGSKRGGIFFTSGLDMLRDLADEILGDQVGDDELGDLAGEVTNTISGNLRRTFGSEYIISVPVVMRNSMESIRHHLTHPVIMIPIEWRSNQALLAIGLE
ncbi:chemotaxis protein CheX [Salinispira pacifica]|uniref:Chemotaxis phosphatase CheX-like domain-containing protein n=1 Tax=Salinispira pacifica TaxID=1307761 RepID=V5WGQ0_9SPIO|nr:chemotaxis protein CheX [Salinispira pacifica]AHC14968.1 hypothetical protein L21SP2_1579 [Salinispira pacifica]